MSEKTELLAQVNQLVGSPEQQDDFELEARIGIFRGKRFVSNVGIKNFYRALDYFQNNPDFVYITQEITEYTKGFTEKELPTNPDIVHEATFVLSDQGVEKRIRESYIDLQDEFSPRFFQIKYNVDHVDMHNYFTRFSKAREQHVTTQTRPEDNIPIPPGSQPQSLRIKHRWSFEPTDYENDFYPYRIDLTHVTGWYVNDRREQVPLNTYEVELEVVNKPIDDADTDLWPGIRAMLALLQNTPFPVTADTISNVILGFNDLFNPDITSLTLAMQQRNQGWYFNRRFNIFNIVNKPVNLKIEALLMPNSLAITDKADGERRLMYIRSDGAYLLYPPNEVMRYLRLPTADDDDDYFITPKHAQDLDGTVLDGEIVINKDGTRNYLAFDLIVDRGIDYRKHKFSDRYRQLKDLLAENPINVSIKEFYFAENDFYTLTAKVLDEIPNKPYGNDGLIFNNINADYNGMIYKWKPLDQLTIDFEVNQVGPVRFELVTGSGKNRKVFTGTPQDPHPRLTIIDPPLVDDSLIANGQIVEMLWDHENHKFVPFRIRYDRDQPNKESTAIDIWKDIMNPIAEDTIRGKDLKVMRHYHNVIKKNMLEDNCKNSTIVDIGSGRGGDLHKWKKLGHATEVLAVEPNTDYLREFNTRLLSSGYAYSSLSDDDAAIYNFKNKFNDVTAVLLNAQGQDTDKIVKTFSKFLARNRSLDSAGCITIFNVLTFFFDKEASLDALVSTIDKLLRVGGSFMGIAMDGDQVRQLFDDHYLLRETIFNLEPDQYWNLDSKKRVNIRTIKKFYRDKKYKLVSKDDQLLQKTVKELNKPLRKKVSDTGWTISKTGKFTSSPYGNQIKIHLGGDTIVHDQTEYLVDINELTRKLAEKNISVENTELLRNDNLAPSQRTLNSLFRTFTFKRQRVPVSFKKQQIELIPLAGVTREQLENMKRDKKLAETILEKNKQELATAKETIKKLKDKEGRQVMVDRKQAKIGEAVAKKKITAKKEEIQQLEEKIKDTEKRLGVTKPVVILDPTATQKKPLKAKKITRTVRPKTKESASAKVKVNYEYADDVFAAADDLEPEMLKPEERAELEFDGQQFIRIGNMQPECILSAILRAKYPSYIMKQNAADAKDLTKKQIKEREEKIEDMLDRFVEKHFKYAYNHDELEFVQKYYPEWSSAKKALKKCQNWKWLDVYNYIAKKLKVNLTIITFDSPFTKPTVYTTVSADNDHEKTVTLYSHNGVYDTLGKVQDDSLVTVE